jgi:hypothetical protein
MIFDWLTATGLASVVWVVGVLLFLGCSRGCRDKPHGTSDADRF